MNFTSPMTLERFGESNNIRDVSKSIFPYELWENMEDLLRCTKFPPLMAFKSSLTRSGGKKWKDELEEICNELVEGSNEKENWECVTKYFRIPVSELKKILEFKFGCFSLIEDPRFSEDICPLPTSGTHFELPTSPMKYKFSKEFFDKNCLTMLDYLRHVLINIIVDSEV